MRSNTPFAGMTTWTELASVAADRARTDLDGPIRLSACDVRELGTETEGALSIEAWPVHREASIVTILVIAMLRDAPDHGRMTAQGRFTFTSAPTVQTGEYPA